MYHIEKNTVQETLIIPLYGRKVWSKDFANVSARSYMRGYRDIYKDVRFFHKIMIKFCDSLVKMQIIKITFK